MFYRVLFLYLFTSMSCFASSNEFFKDEFNLRWNLPADAWPYMKGYVAKGHFLRITNTSKNFNEDILVNGIKLFDNSELKGRHYLLTYSNIKTSSGNAICSEQLPFVEVRSYSELMICSSFCRDLEISKDELKQAGPLKVVLFDSYLKSGLYKECEFQPDGFLKKFLVKNGPDNDIISETVPYLSQNTDSGTNLYLKTVDTSFKKGYVKIDIQGKTFYLETSFCQKDTICKFLDIDKSEYEKEMSRLKMINNKKNFDPLNGFIAELKPCVIKKDKECIKKFFPKPMTEMEAKVDGVYQYKEVHIDDELISELMACLNYNSLLPHLIALKGVKKACLMKLPDISGMGYIMVDYPEAVRYRKDFAILVKKE